MALSDKRHQNPRKMSQLVSCVARRRLDVIALNPAHNAFVIMSPVFTMIGT
jgi:hypothetical protein